MKTAQLFIVLWTWATAMAAPAIVWKQKKDDSTTTTSTLHHADEIPISLLFPQEQEQGVVFVLNRLKKEESDDDAWTYVNIPQTIALPAQAHYHHVTGITSPHLLARQASSTSTTTTKIAEVTFEEFQNLSQVIEQLQTTTQNNKQGKSMTKSKKRLYELQNAQVFVVSVDIEAMKDTDPLWTQLDATLVKTIQTTPHVVLTAVRSIDEIKQERERAMQHRMHMQRQAGWEQQIERRRRLEEDNADQQQGQQDNQQQQNNNNQYMVLVHMTPNILSGILFTLLFATITLIGITCMGAIQGQDVYVKKMPAIGREA